MDGDERTGEAADEGGIGQQYGVWLSRELGPGWVEVEPGIFQPRPAAPEGRSPGSEADEEPETLDEALRPRKPEREPQQPVTAPAKRGWWRRG